MPREPIRVRRVFQPLPMRGVVLWEISRRFHRLCPGRGQVAHVLRTLPPVAATGIATRALPLDLHVLSLPLAFILSQDQTLHCKKHVLLNLSLKSQRYCLKSFIKSGLN